MKISNYDEVVANPLMLPGAKDAKVRLLIGPEDNPPNFVMLAIELAPGGNTPEHHHEWEEEIFVKSGEGKIKLKDDEKHLRAGDVLLLDPDESHQFINTRSEPMEFICVIPKRG